MNKPFSPRVGLAFFAIASFGLIAPLSAAPFIDNFTTTTNLSTFGSVSVSVSSNTLTASRTAPSVDSGFDWNPGGPGNYFSLDGGDSQFIFSLDATNAVNGGYYNISVLLWDSNGVSLGEVLVQSDTNALGTFSYDVTTAAISFPTATQWSVHMRVLPFNSTDAAFEFQNFQAVPEPTAFALGATGFILLALRRRRA